MKKVFLTIAIFALLIGLVNIIGTKKAEAYYYDGYGYSYMPTYYYQTNYVNPISSMQTFNNNLWNIVNRSSMEYQQIETNYWLQEISNSLIY